MTQSAQHSQQRSVGFPSTAKMDVKYSLTDMVVLAFDSKKERLEFVSIVRLRVNFWFVPITRETNGNPQLIEIDSEA
jgi:hypothetical protein